MLYSIIPAEIVFDETDDEAPNTYQQITFDNRQFIVEPMEDNCVRIVQLISSDPTDFMNTSYQPGGILEFSPRIFTE